MTRLIRFGAVVDDNWQVLPRDHQGELPDGAIIAPLCLWQKDNDLARDRADPLGIWIDVDEDVETLGVHASDFALVAINFPTFMDGRGFSTARLLRDRYGYKGEIRAIGNVIRDQMFYMKRCGFDAFQLREGTNLEAALASLQDFDTTYQGATDQPAPLFRRRSG